MGHPLFDNLNPMREDIYGETGSNGTQGDTHGLYLDYFMEKAKLSFPSIYAENKQFSILIRVMAWAVARSYQQPLILKYLYNTDLVMDELLPRLADTLGFKYPYDYAYDKLRVLIKYIQKIRRARGTINSIKQLIRLLEISEEEILELPLKDYASIIVERCVDGLYSEEEVKELWLQSDLYKAAALSMSGITDAAQLQAALDSFPENPFANLVGTPKYEYGIMLIHYNSIFGRHPIPEAVSFNVWLRQTIIDINTDMAFANKMLRLVMPAGYSWRLESGLESEPDVKLVVRNRVELVTFSESIHMAGDFYFGEAIHMDSNKEHISILYQSYGGDPAVIWSDVNPQPPTAVEEEYNG